MWGSQDPPKREGVPRHRTHRGPPARPKPPTPHQPSRAKTTRKKDQQWRHSRPKLTVRPSVGFTRSDVDPCRYTIQKVVFIGFICRPVGLLRAMYTRPPPKVPKTVLNRTFCTFGATDPRCGGTRTRQSARGCQDTAPTGGRELGRSRQPLGGPPAPKPPAKGPIMAPQPAKTDRPAFSMLR